MAEDYIPTSDANALLWLRAFADRIAEDPAIYQLTASDSANILTAVDEYQEALFVATSEFTRNEGTVNAKDTKKNAAVALCRQYAIQIKYNNGITDEQKIYIGVRPVNNSREAVYCPQSSPLINITANTPGAQTLKFADALDTENRGKPFGAAALQLYLYIGDAATMNEDDAQFLGLYTKNPIVVAFQPEDDGKMATFFARWSGKRGDTGQFSLPVSMRIAA